jgi:hypothetical protein
MKYLLTFLLGAGAGVIGTYLYFNNKIENIIDEKVNKEMEFFYEHQSQTLSSDDVEEVSEEEIKEKESDKPETQEKTSIQKMESIIRTNYREPDKDTDHGNDGYEEDDDEDEEYITDEEMEELMKESQKRMAQQPHIITEEEQDTTLIGYDNEEYIWYPKENFITDAFDNRLEEQDLLDILFKPIDWRKELKNKEKIIVRVPEEATNYTVWNHDNS